MERRFDLLTRQIKTNFWATVWLYVRTDRRGGVSGKLVAYGRAALSTEKIAYGGTDRKFGTWPSSRARSTYYYYTTPGRTCQVFFQTKIKKIRGLILGLSRAVEAVIFATVTTCHIVGRELLIVGASATATTMFMANVIVIGVPHDCEVVAFIHRVFKGTLARNRTVAVVWTVPTIYGAMDVSHYSSPPIAFISSAKASIIMQPISISAFSP